MISLLRALPRLVCVCGLHRPRAALVGQVERYAIRRCCWCGEWLR